MGFKKKVDSNQQKIVDVLRDFGFTVFPTHTIGRGFPDLVVGYRGRTYLVEVKDSSVLGWKLNETQEKFHKNWPASIAILDSVDAAITWAKLIMEETCRRNIQPN